MNNSTFVLLVLLALDAITTIYLLEYVPNTVELNPLLTQFSNVILAVVLSHFLAALVIIAIDKHLYKLEVKKRMKINILMVLVILFYVGVVFFNTVSIVLGHIFYI